MKDAEGLGFVLSSFLPGMLEFANESVLKEGFLAYEFFGAFGVAVEVTNLALKEGYAEATMTHPLTLK